MEKTLGEVAYESWQTNVLGGTFDWVKHPFKSSWEAAAQAVIAEVERRKAAAEPPTDEEAAMWLSGATVQAIKAYRARRKCTLKEAYTSLKGLAAPPEATNAQA